MKVETAIAVELRAAAESGDVQGVVQAFEADSVTEALTADVKELRGRMLNGKALRPGLVVAAFTGLQAAMLKLGWIGAARDKRLQARVAELEARIAKLEAQPLRYEGVHEAGKVYTPGAFVTYTGSVWHCNYKTASRPGDGAAWTLAVKHGRDLR